MTKNEFDSLDIGQKVCIKSGPLKLKYYETEMKVVAKHVLQIPQRLYILNEYKDIINDGLAEPSLIPFGYVIEMIPTAWDPRRSVSKENHESYVINENSVCALYQDVQVLPVLSIKEE